MARPCGHTDDDRRFGCPICRDAHHVERYARAWDGRAADGDPRWPAPGAAGGKPAPAYPPPRDPPPAAGPGTELERLLLWLGFKPAGGCGCKRAAREMDRLGVGGCRGPDRERLVAVLRDGGRRAGWGAWLRAAGKAVASRLAFRIDPRDPAPGLYDEAVRRAERAAADRTGGKP